MMRDEMERVGVIGSGLGGLAAACTLAARGYAVTVFEKNEWVGGKAAVLQEGGFRFDMGPTILLMPSVLKRIFAEAGREMAAYLELVKLEPQWRCFFQDGGKLDLVGDAQAMGEELREFSGEKTAAGYAKFMELSTRLGKISDDYFFWRSVGGLTEMMEPGKSFNLKTAKDVFALRMWSTMGATVRKHVPDKRVAQMVDHFTQYVGSNPEASPAVLCGIGHMQTSEGIWYPMGGTGAVPRALAKLARELGVEFRTGCGVRRILVEKGEVVGLTTEAGERVELGALVSNADSVTTIREMIGGPIATKFDKKREYEPACSGVVLYLGLKQRYEHLAHHDFVFSRDPHEEFEAIYKQGMPAPDPTCYLCSPSRTEPATAPAGGDALYVLVHTPYLRAGHDWNQMFPEYRRVILEKLKTTGQMPDLEERIVFEKHLTPVDIERRYGSRDGAIYGLVSHGRLTGAFKPGNRSPQVKGLYLAGGAAHPGAGMPMVMMSGWIAADSLDKDCGVVSGGVVK
jgi:phytoene desaturase